jgi:hypothetical protein
MTDPAISCPGCLRPLHVPADAVGKTAHCPHCRTNFFLPRNPDGTPGTPVLPKLRFAVPRMVAAPAFALLTVAFVGVVVNGTLLGFFLLKPGADLAYARGRVLEIRSIDMVQGLKEAKRADPAAAPAPDPEQDARDEELAELWAPAMKPLHTTFLVVSLLTAAGAGAMLAGRWYPLALFGCLAAAVNVNNFCCVPGAIAGVWAFLVLIRDDSRKHFGIELPEDVTSAGRPG